MVMLKENYVLGIWDGHDAGAALLEGSRILFAVNEERLSRRKLEVGFPRLSIEACLRYAAISPAAVGIIAVSTTDPAKTLTRIFPSLKEEYYLLRRRKKAPGAFDPLKKCFKYRFTESPPNGLSRWISRRYFEGRLKEMGFSAYQLDFVDHHSAHAIAAAGCSGFPECLVVTLDGVGDGLSGSIWTFKEQRLKRVHAQPAGVSLGIFFEHVTNLMNMRELEDEGKVMALANYAWPIDDSENPLLKIIRVEGLEAVSDLSSTAMFREMKKILWRYPSEQFAYMAQRVLEKSVVALVGEALQKTGMRKIAASGGVFSNIKMNMKIASLPSCENISVFPHMGDGGLALGAAIMANRERAGHLSWPLNDLSLGTAFDRDEVLAACMGDPSIRFCPLESVSEAAARMVLDGEIILWFQGRMEIGPRALGNRSILARPDDRRIRDRLNLLLKKRVWYQPFCPSMLMEDAPEILAAEGIDLRDNRFMTMGFQVRDEHIETMQGVINVDGTCRPHFVLNENPRYRELLIHIKKRLGYGVVLNTSFNIHGEPLVCSPSEAVDVLKRTGIRYLFIEDVLVENLQPRNP